MDFTNPCGGVRWKIDDDGMIEVEGQGYPTVAPGSTAYQYMVQTWQNFGDLFQRSASTYGLPVQWVLAVATMETGFLSADAAKQAGAVSPVGAIGVMQIMPFNAKTFGLSDPSELYDPAANIDVGVHLLSKLNQNANAGGLPGIAALYNSGKLCTTDSSRNQFMLLEDSNYSEHVIEWNNAALQNGIVSSLSPTSLAVLGAAVGGALALAITRTKLRKEARATRAR